MIGIQVQKQNYYIYLWKNTQQLIGMQIEFNRNHKWMVNVLRLNVHVHINFLI